VTKAYVVCSGNARVVPVTLAARSVGSTISVGTNPGGIAIAPDGATAYVTSAAGGTLTPISLSSDSPGTAISLTGCTTPSAVAILPDGTTAYVACSGNGKVVPVTLTNGSVGSPISVGSSPDALGVLPAGTTVYVANGASSSVTPIDVSTNTAGSAISVGTSPAGVAVSPDGKTVYVTNAGDDTATPIAVSSGSAGTAIAVGGGPVGVAFAPDQAPTAWLAVTPGAPGASTHFDASSSSVDYGTVAVYSWDFGDGSTASGSSPTIDHVYAAGCSYTVKLTETTSGGTSTTQVFTGQTVSRHGSPAAQATQVVAVSRNLALAIPTTVSFSTTLTGLSQVVNTGLPLDVAAGTTSSGWSISATSTLFSTGGATPHTLPATSVTVGAQPSVNCIGGAPCTAATTTVGYPLTLPAGTTAPAAVKVFDASTGSGICDQSAYPVFSLAIPANAYAGTYSSTWTFAIASGP
jgi:YVTN family beta-propeller protein